MVKYRFHHSLISDKTILAPLNNPAYNCKQLFIKQIYKLACR